MRMFHQQWCTSSKRENAKNIVDNSLNVLQDILSDIFKILDQRMSQEASIKSKKRRVSFEVVSFSAFTITTEDTPKSPTLTNTLLLDSGVQTVLIKDSGNNVENSRESVSSVSMPINRSLEEEFLDKRNANWVNWRKQRMKQRPERAKKKAEIEIKKLELEFERKRQDHDEQKRQLEWKLQIKMLEANLETSLLSKPSSESESKVEQRSKAARSLKSNELKGVCTEHASFFATGRLVFVRKNT